MSTRGKFNRSAISGALAIFPAGDSVGDNGTVAMGGGERCGAATTAGPALSDGNTAPGATDQDSTDGARGAGFGWVTTAGALAVELGRAGVACDFNFLINSSTARFACGTGIRERRIASCGRSLSCR